jgi:iron-regulated transporter 1
MRRIDLVCKLVGPLAIALIDGASRNAAIFFILATNAAAAPIEYFAIAQVCQRTIFVSTLTETG